ncbi:MAG: hypothetical protein L0Z50_30685 [Verrucomicrobiales bacterium]|nr:hypothetical protein [Verrucomicrobiales bacterium]
MNKRCHSQVGLAIATMMLVVPCGTAPQSAQTTQSGQAANPPDRFKASKDPMEAASCRDRLKLIHDSIAAFKNDHQRLPSWLSELSPRYLDASLLVCPYVAKIGDLRSWRSGFRDDVFQDPKESTSYAYEFNNIQRKLWTGVTKTWNEYKHRQMERMGPLGRDAVPIVRCFEHDPVLNLAYSGRIYASGGVWETLYEPRFSHDDHHPESLFFHESLRVDPSRFPRRAASAEARLLDLSSHYNAYIDDAWLPWPSDSDLRGLAPGAREFGGMRFDARGVVQLKGAGLLAPYPVLVPGIAIGRACTNIHFLHATRLVSDHAAKVADGSKVAGHVVHYRSGAQVEIPILYGRDVKDWWYDPLAPDHGPAKVVWEGENLASIGWHRKMRLFHTTWTNSWKDQPIDSLSLVSAMAETAPFVIAITVE